MSKGFGASLPSNGVGLSGHADLNPFPYSMFTS